MVLLQDSVAVQLPATQKFVPVCDFIVTLERPFQRPGLSCGRGTGSQTARRKQVKATARTATMLQLDGPFRKGRCSENGN